MPASGTGGGTSVVGIVLLNWNNEPATRRALESLRLVKEPAHRVYVVDNGSVDGSMESLERAFAADGHTWIRNGENRGFSGGCNPGIRKALADGAGFVLLLNNDCIIADPGFLAALVKTLREHPRVGLVGGKILAWPETGTIWSTGGFVSGWRQRYVGAGEPDRGQYDRPAVRTFLSGALMLVRREVFERIGLLPEEYFFGHEDWEFGVRARQAGFELRYEPAAVVQHEAGKSHDAVEPFYVYNDALSRMLFEKRVLPRPSFALWRALYGAYLRFVLPLGIRVRPQRYLTGVSPDVLLSCLRQAHADIEWLDRITPLTLERFRAAGRRASPQSLRVAHLVATSGQTGVESHLRVLFEGLRSIGHEPVLICPARGPLTEALEERGFEVRLAAPRRRFGFVGLGRTARAVRDADVVHAHGPRAIWWSAARRLGRPGRPAVATVHQIDQSGVGSAWRRPLYRAIERSALRAHARVIAVSTGLREQVLRATGLAPEVVRRVPASAPLLLEPPRKVQLPDSPPRIVVVARFSREKGIDILLDAWADPRLAARDVVLHVVGDGPERAALEERARPLGRRVIFRGWRADPLAEIAGAHAYVAPSRVETFGIAVLEAMALGVPVVATDVAGHRDLFGEEFAGALVPAENRKALADGLVGFLSLPASQQAEFGFRLQKRAHQEFSPRRMAEGTSRVYAEARGAAARRPQTATERTADRGPRTG